MVYDEAVDVRAVQFVQDGLGVDDGVRRFQDKKVDVLRKEYFRVVGHSGGKVAGEEDAFSFRLDEEGVGEGDVSDGDRRDFDRAVVEDDAFAVLFIFSSAVSVPQFEVIKGVQHFRKESFSRDEDGGGNAVVFRGEIDDAGVLDQPEVVVVVSVRDEDAADLLGMDAPGQ